MLAKQKTAERQSYYLTRLKRIGITPQKARRYGLTESHDGDLVITPTTFDGTPYTYFDQEAFDRQMNRRSDVVVHEKAYYHTYQKTRYSDLKRERIPGLPRYNAPTGQGAKPFSGILAKQAYQEGRKGGTVVFIEGELKAVALEEQGIEAIAFGGNRQFKIVDRDRGKGEVRNDEVQKAIVQREYKSAIIALDADAREIKLKEGKAVTDGRARGFYDGVYSFAKEFFETRKEHGLSTRLFLQVVKSNAGAKGVDDLMEIHDPQKVALEVENCAQDGRFVETIELHASRYQDQLQTFFGLSSYRDFFELYGPWIEQAGNTFIYQGRRYRVTWPENLLYNVQPCFHLVDDPYQTDVDRTTLEVNKWLSEAEGELVPAIMDNAKKFLAISSPTASGKTTFAATFANKARRRGFRDAFRIAIAVPTVTIAKQKASEYGDAVALHGTYKKRKALAASHSGVVFCTFDTLHQIPDLPTRIVFIDEAHLLPLAMDYRREAITRMLKASEKARKVVLLSGTMPDTLPAALQADYIDVIRKENPLIRLRVVESEYRRLDKLAENAIEELTKADLSGKYIHFLFLQSTDRLEDMRRQLIEGHGLEKHEIAILARRPYDAGETHVLDYLEEHDRIKKGVKVVLCTNLIAEGINVDNKNIGRVFWVGHRCQTTFHQFTARFRKIDVLDVTAILPRERDLGPQFLDEAFLDAYNDRKEQAELFRKGIERRRQKKREQIADADLEYLDRIEAENGRYNSRYFDHILQVEAGGRYEVSELSILYQMHDELLQNTNNAYFLQQVTTTGNVEMVGREAGTVSDQVKEAAKATRDDRKAILDDRMEKAKEALAADGKAVLAELRGRYEQAGNKEGVEKLERLVPDLEPVDDHSEGVGDLLEEKKVRTLCLYYARMLFLEADKEALADFLADYNERDAKERWRQLEAIATRHRYNTSDRANMHEIHILEAEAMELIEREFTGDRYDVYSPSHLADKIGRITNHTRIGADCVQRSTISPQKALSMIQDVFFLEQAGTRKKPFYKLTGKVYLQRKRQGAMSVNSKKLYCLFDNIRRKPLKIKALSEFSRKRE